jgi:PAS domain S-box-containing protein
MRRRLRLRGGSYVSKRRLNRYLVAALSVGAVLCLRALLAPIVHERSPYMLLNLAVMVSAWYGGLWPGLLASFLSAFAGHYFFVAPLHSFTLAQTKDEVAVTLFLAVTVSISWLAHLLHSATLRAEEDERRVSEVLESIADSFVALDRDWCFLYINRAAAAFLNRAPQELLGKNIWAEYPKLGGSRLGAVYREVYRSHAPAHFEYFLRATKTWFQVNVYPSKQGGISIYFLDNTQRKRHEAEAGRLAAIVEACEDAIMSVTPDGVIQSWNSGAERLYGYTAEEAIGRSIYMLLPAERLEEETALIGRLRQGERIEHFETVRVRKDRKHIHVSLSISPIRDTAGKIIGISGIARDVTARVELEEQLRQTQKLESLGVLAGGVAHDFNNLLVSIMGNASLAMERLPALDPGRPLLREVVQAGERASNLTRQLLAYAGRGRFVIEPVDLSEVVRETAQLLRASIPKNVDLQLDLAPGLPPVEADIRQMQQIVMNLVINAGEAIGDKNGWVRVRTSLEAVGESFAIMASWTGGLRPGRYVRLEVRDNGCGMDEGTRARIFDPFFTTKFTGRGLGLSAVSGIVRGHGGVIEVESAPGQGSALKLWLPAGPAKRMKGPKQTLELGGRGTILFVDDEEAVRRTAAAALERYGYTVRLAEDGYQAEEQVRRLSREILLVILDMAMPGISGQETFRRLKALRPDLPVLLLSGFNELEAARHFQGEGVAGFLQKPYTAVQLAEKVKSVETR